MEVHQLRYLVAVAEEGSFTAAAERERVSQSGVSAQVGKLERELGLRLLERGGRVVVPTDAGHAVLEHARAVLRALTAVDAVAGDLRGLVRGRVRLGMVTGCSVPAFLDAVARFRLLYPGVDLGLVEGESAGLLAAVRAGEVDLALVGHAEELPDGLETAAVVVEGLVAVLGRAGHRASDPQVLTLADLAGEVLLLLPVGTGVRGALERSLTEAGLPGTRGRRTLEASSPATLLGLARRGAGVAVLSASMVEGASDGGLRAVPISDATVPARLSLVWRPDPQAAASRLLSGLRSALCVT